MTHTLSPLHLNKPSVLLSQCLLGDPVRYDGAHKQHPLITHLLAPQIHREPLCPEMAAGMGVPRPAIRRQRADGVDVIALASSGAPMANSLQASCQQLATGKAAQRAVAALLKARSPSCGIQTSPLFSPQGEILAMGDGVLVQQLKLRQPDLLLVDEEQLQSPAACIQFLRLCQLALAWQQNVLSDEWLGYLHNANSLHQMQGLGLQRLAGYVGREWAELDYLEPLPFVLLEG